MSQVVNSSIHRERDEPVPYIEREMSQVVNSSIHRERDESDGKQLSVMTAVYVYS